MATYWENSCSFGLRYVSWYKYLIVSLVFSHLGFWSGNLFLIAPFPDLCLLVPFNALLKVHSIKSRSFSLIRLCGNVVYRVEKSYVDKLVARNPLHFNLLSTSPEFFIDQNQFLFEVSYTVSQYLIT